MSEAAVPAGPGIRRAGPGGARFLAQLVGRATLTVLSGMLLWSVAPLAAGWSSQVVVSGSMLPRIAPGDVVVTQHLDPAHLVPGQIILVANPARPGTLLLHRMVARNPDGTFTTRGDANNVADSTHVPAGNVRGLARLRVPYVGLPMLWLRHRSYGSLLLAVAVVLAAVVVSAGREEEPVTADPRGPQPTGYLVRDAP